MSYHYLAYGLQIESDFEINAFRELDITFDKQISLQIIKTPINFEGYYFKDDFVVRAHTDEGFLYVIKNMVAFLVTEKQIKVHPLVKKNEIWQSFLVGGAMSIVLLKRGYFLLHGSAVEHANKAFLFLGQSGAGKSSVATALEQISHSIITDDICTLSNKKNGFYINSGTKQARLLKDTVEKLDIDSVQAIEHPAVQTKYGYQFNKTNAAKTKIHKIIELVVDENAEKEISIEEITSFERIELLKRNIYKEELASIVKGKDFGFQFIMMSVNIKCFRVKRKQSKYDLKELAEQIHQQLILKE